MKREEVLKHIRAGRNSSPLIAHYMGFDSRAANILRCTLRGMVRAGILFEIRGALPIKYTEERPVEDTKPWAALRAFRISDVIPVSQHARR